MRSVHHSIFLVFIVQFGLPALTFEADRPWRSALVGQAPGDAGDIAFEERYLDNGLHIILAVDPAASAVAVNLWYDVGSRHEPEGRSGLAHLFEHLMFQGSENVDPGEHGRLIERAGGILNASATEDRTNFYQTVPPERLNLALWLEADRMASLVVDRANMGREIDVVQEERRLRIDNAPYGSSQIAGSYSGPYDAASCFAYAHATIGSMQDLETSGPVYAQEFFDLYYAPGNATLAIVGAFDSGVAMRLVREYFGGIEARDPPPEVACETPFSGLPRDLTVDDPNAVLPAVFVSYGVVDAAHPDAPALDVLARILGGGESARLYRRLVREERIALDASAFSDPRKGPGIFQLLAVANQGVGHDALVGALDAEIDSIVGAGVTLDELERARNQIEASVVLGRQTVMGRAEALQSANHYHGSPTAVRNSVALVRSVSAEDVRRVAENYLTRDNRVIVRTRPRTGAGGMP